MAAYRKYRWEVWLSEPRTVLVRGRDYQCSQSTMSQTIRNNASKRGVRIHLTDLGDSLVLEVPSAVHDTTETPVPG